MRPLILRTIALSLLAPTAALALETQHYQGTRFVTGGIGSEEVEAIRQSAADYSLGLTFAAASGPYLSGIKVEIRNQAGEVVLSTVSDGPMVLVDLPKGRYSVIADFDGNMQRRDVTIGGEGHRKLVMHWTVPGLTEPSREAAPPPAGGGRE